MVDSLGGGISQFTTTLFNAVFYGGYDVVERMPHSFYFQRYPMGLDATISYPKPDLVFRNDTQAGMLIKAEYTETSITVKIYGNNGGRKVQAKRSAPAEVVKPPVKLLPNPKLDATEEKTKASGKAGWSVHVTRIISYSDGTQREERRKVVYKPQAREVEVHPCRIPKGEEGYTGEKCPEPEPASSTEDDTEPPLEPPPPDIQDP